ncbi:MAG TPA: sigma-70 family RNA polymerase sigma factor, partial [Terriglobales bacterium]|nr:sigma-70 family RNA polymerase sigma factor [Terriglobales bacterium]
MGSLPDSMSISVKPSDPAALREQDLLRRVQAGEKEYFYELIKPYQRRVYSAALAVLRNEADAEDAAQEAFLKALTHIQQFRAEARFSTWLIQIAVNEALMRKRRAHAEIMEPVGEKQDEEGAYTPRDFADWREIPSETLERKEIRSRLAAAVAALAEKYRQVFVLRDVQHMSIEE